MLEFSGIFHYATDMAIKVDFDGDGEGFWLPRSQIECGADIDVLGEGSRFLSGLLSRRA